MATPTARSARYAVNNGRVIGSGAYRKAVRTRRGKWVYKINHPFAEDHGNEEEYRTYSILKSQKLPEGIKIPEMHLLSNGILAAEYIQGKHPDTGCFRSYHDDECPKYNNWQAECWTDKFADVKIRDIHRGNVLVTSSGDIYIIDLGHGLQE